MAAYCEYSFPTLKEHYLKSYYSLGNPKSMVLFISVDLLVICFSSSVSLILNCVYVRVLSLLYNRWRFVYATPKSLLINIECTMLGMLTNRARETQTIWWAAFTK